MLAHMLARARDYINIYTFRARKKKNPPYCTFYTEPSFFDNHTENFIMNLTIYFIQSYLYKKMNTSSQNLQFAVTLTFVYHERKQQPQLRHKVCLIICYETRLICDGFICNHGLSRLVCVLVYLMLAYKSNAKI